MALSAVVPMAVINYGRQINEEDSEAGLDCAICFGGPDGQDFLGHSAQKAVHAFHKQCFETWMQKSATCPICRDPFERKVEEISPEFLFIPSEVALCLTSSLLEPAFPGVTRIAEEHVNTAKSYIQTELLLSSALTTVLFVAQVFPMVPQQVFCGAVLGYAVSSLSRMVNSEDRNTSPYDTVEDRTDTLLNSSSFKAAVITAAVGAILATGAPIAVTSFATFAAGAALNYGVEKLHEHHFISDENKAKAQQAITVISAVGSFISPMKAVGSTVIGAAAGAAIRSAGTISGAVKNLWNWARQ